MTAYAAEPQSAAKTSAPSPAKYEAGSYAVDPSHSKVGFGVKHLGILNVEGRFKQFEGTINLDPVFEKTTFKAKVDVSSIDTGEKKRDEHLLSPDFFNAPKDKVMSFESTEIKGTPESFKIMGNLTIRGITKTVVLDSKFLGQAKDGYGNLKSAIEAKTVISRKDFDLKWNQVAEGVQIVGDDVTIDLSIQAAKALKK
ncbi:MAG: YceI family protein [Proteobacteria bacterium]|nr:MAG: YceI family protein [Pseudomonadota bacterium]